MEHLHTLSEKKKKKSKVTIGTAFKTIIWPRRGYVLLGLVLIMIKSLSGFVLPMKSKVLLDDVVVNKDYDQL
ncbi:MAG: ABC transporter ATP-binding protein, partial [Flavobacteriaceae bacterium]|nr:ABC transporter ATP-binding protein [Flavobacteriaceae bacterium]